MADKIRAGLWVCRSGYFTTIDGASVAVKRGTLLPVELPYEVADGNEQWWVEREVAAEPVGPFKTIGVAGRAAEPVVEQATAAPGEVRDVQIKPAKRGKGKKD